MPHREGSTSRLHSSLRCNADAVDARRQQDIRIDESHRLQAAVCVNRFSTNILIGE